jgi:hypothetical protein
MTGKVPHTVALAPQRRFLGWRPLAPKVLRRENFVTVRLEVANFWRFRKLVDPRADAALELFRLKTRLVLHSSQS